jgi:CRISPR-associated protein Cmr4
MKQYRLFLQALDPTHLGAGGYRLGRVDNTIIRDAATGLPKIPGTSINGVTRTYAIYSLPDDEKQQAMAYARHTLKPKDFKRPHSGKIDPVAHNEKDMQGEEGTARSGMVYFRDAEILAFPVPTLVGARWVTTASLLKNAGCDIENGPEELSQIWVQNSADTNHPRFNLGWLLLKAEQKKIPLPNGIDESIKKNLVLVHEDLFPSIVNANLETRTSVSMDFETGAGAEGLLFTYEATPRGTIFLGQVDFDTNRFPELDLSAFDLVERSLNLACQLGIGGMATRGFGRMQPTLKER